MKLKLSKIQKIIYNNLQKLPKVYEKASKRKKIIIELLLKEYLHDTKKPFVDAKTRMMHVLGDADEPIDLTETPTVDQRLYNLANEILTQLNQQNPAATIPEVSENIINLTQEATTTTQPLSIETVNAVYNVLNNVTNAMRNEPNPVRRQEWLALVDQILQPIIAIISNYIERVRQRSLSYIERLGLRIQSIYFFIPETARYLINQLVFSMLVHRSFNEINPNLLSNSIEYLLLYGVVLALIFNVLFGGNTFLNELRSSIQTTQQQNTVVYTGRKAPTFYIEGQNITEIMDPIYRENVLDFSGPYCWLKCGHIVIKENFDLWVSSRISGEIEPFYECPTCRQSATSMEDMCVEVENREKLQRLLQRLIEEPTISGDALRQAVFSVISLKF